MNENELYHYGVKGMKWGVRKDPAKAYEKASKKLAKLDSYVDRQQQVALRRRDRADSLSTRRFVSAKKKAKARVAARKSSVRLGRFIRRADRWYKAMDKAFKDTPISLTSEQIDMGKKYVEMNKIRALSY